MVLVCDSEKKKILKLDCSSLMYCFCIFLIEKDVVEEMIVFGFFSGGVVFIVGGLRIMKTVDEISGSRVANLFSSLQKTEQYEVKKNSFAIADTRAI